MIKNFKISIVPLNVQTHKGWELGNQFRIDHCIVINLALCTILFELPVNYLGVCVCEGRDEGLRKL